MEKFSLGVNKLWQKFDVFISVQIKEKSIQTLKSLKFMFVPDLLPP